MSMVKAKMDIYNGDTLAVTCTCGEGEGIGAGALESFTINREGDTSKFFGFGVCQKLNINLIDLDRELTVDKTHKAVIGLGDGEVWDTPYPNFYIEEIKRDENTNTITATAYDRLYWAAGRLFNELGINPPYTLKAVAQAISGLLQLTLKIDDAADALFDIEYEEGANLEGTEDIRSILNAIAEVTQTVYFVNNSEELYFKRLDKDGDAVLPVTREDYYYLDTQTPRTLTAICNATELGDNLEVDIYSAAAGEWVLTLISDAGWNTSYIEGEYLMVTGDPWTVSNGSTTYNLFPDTPILLADLNPDETYTVTCDADVGTYELAYVKEEIEKVEGGITQYIRNNPFLELRLDVDTVLNNAIATVGGFTITQFNCDWTGNYLLEIGDKISLETEDGGTVYSYVLSDIVTYAGTLNELTEWECTEQSSDTFANPTNISEKINQTFAKVDKVNKEITLVAAKANEHTESIGQLQVTTGTIEASVKSVETKTQTSIDSLEESVQKLTDEVNLKMTDDDLTIAITSTLAEGVDKVVTATKKYTFDDTGLNIGSSDSSISTVVTEDGMRINRSGQEVLTADNTGVKAEDLHATTYLIIGDNSRFEDWQSRYTACFWIGGNN